MYGENVKYSIELLTFGDKNRIQSFSCGNESLDRYIKTEIFSSGELDCSDGLHFKVFLKESGEIIGFFSLAASGIIHKVMNYLKILPAVKIDVFAIDLKYQRLHFNEESEKAENPLDHLYFSDAIMLEVVKRIRNISETEACVDYIVLYSARNKEHFYTRNMFSPFEPFMEKESNQEIIKNIPMYLEL